MVVLLGLVSAAAPRAGGQETPPAEPAKGRWRIEVLPPVSTLVGDMRALTALDLNEKGQVAGTASFRPDVATTMFRYTPGKGMEDLDPDGRYGSSALAGALNDLGDALGITRNTEGSSEQLDVFRYTDRGGFDFLEKGKTDAIRRGFSTTPGQSSLPRNGRICGHVRDHETGEVRPFLYRRATGWQDLSASHARFASETHVFCKYINERGDVVFAVSNPPGPDDVPPFALQEAFVRLGRSSPIELPTFGRRVNVVGEINDSGMVPGLYVDAKGRERAYVWTLERGLVTLLPKGARESAGGIATESSDVWGIARKGRMYDQVFRYSPDEGLRIAIGSAKLRRLGRRYGQRVPVEDQLDISGANDRGEIVGQFGRGVFFYYSDDTGLVDLRRVLAGLDASLVLEDIREINNRGDILIRVAATPEDGTGVLILRRPRR